MAYTINDYLNQLYKLHPKLIDFNLTRLKNLLDKLDNPEKKLKNVIHVAGTNGKGSTCAFIRSIAKMQSLKVHTYTSPHLVKFNERILINHEEIDDLYLIELIKEVINKNKNNEITFFEITTAICFLAFSRFSHDFCIIETGLGGRLDATNIINDKIVNIITKIGFDHEEFLGSTIKEITFEKCGIFRKNVPVIVGYQNKKEVDKLIKYHASKMNCKLLSLKEIPESWELGLKGNHQYENAKIANTVAKIFFYNIKNETIKNGLKNTIWKGRLELISNGNIVKNRTNITLIDGAHNIDGANVIKNYIKENNLKDLQLILGMMKNKNFIEFVKVLRSNITKIFICPIQSQINSLDSEYVYLNLLKKDILSIRCASLEDALLKTDRTKPLLITGSLYLIGEILKKN